MTLSEKTSIAPSAGPQQHLAQQYIEHLKNKEVKLSVTVAGQGANYCYQYPVEYYCKEQVLGVKDDEKMLKIEIMTIL